MKILITGISGSGKTHLATQLNTLLDADYYNADQLRQQYNDWDFSTEGRLRQANRIKSLCATSYKRYQIADFICPTNELRNIFQPDFTIWMNTKKESIYKDTDKLFEPPKWFDIELATFDYDINNIINWIKLK
jgi:adenylylsulfate kinase